MAVAQIKWYLAGVLFILLQSGGDARIHTLTLKNETRLAVDLNNFGFFADGTLDVNLTSLSIPEKLNYSSLPVGFSLSRSRVNEVFSYTAEETETCPLKTKPTNGEPLILFLIDINNLCVNVSAMGIQNNTLIAKLKGDTSKVERKSRDTSASGSKDNGSKNESDKKKEGQTEDMQITDVEAKKVEGNYPLYKDTNLTLDLGKNNSVYNFSFRVQFGSMSQGLYSLKFHFCQNMYPQNKHPYSFTVDVTERNLKNFLSAAEIPLSRLYICMAGVFFTAAMVWVYTLMKHRYSVFKIHWLMAALAFTKSTSLVFHSINYHFINTEGHPIEGWAVMYYITHLLKGALLFITLALIGTGWAFVKYILSDKEKKIFMIVIPLQVLANVAYIIIESTEEGSSEYYLWKEILFLVDLICCGAILFPVVWSIRHLQEASSTDGKAAMNLEKLKLFRHYYVMIVCYVYFTRIIAILLKITMPFQWQWCYEFLVEMSTLIFFVLTGYKFRPASNNPYLQLPQDEDDVEMDEVVTESGALEGISKVKKTSNATARKSPPTAS
uniref:G protein-coupled receptor 108 n=1 Tax=Nothobranchius korthausae TaxID=1143690 RepID=A0A1A8FNV9_9TELE